MINVAEGRKKEVVLNSEAIMTEQVNKAKGEAESVQLVATATAESISAIASAINLKGGENAVSMRIAEKYIDAFKSLAQTNNSMIIPADTGNVSGVVSQILGTYKQLKKSD
jgi:regulator of protease activity HflC (stomatin/prohibitin superfamily)